MLTDKYKIWLKHPCRQNMDQLSHKFQVWLEMGRLTSSGKWGAWNKKAKRAKWQIEVNKPLLAKAASSQGIAKLSKIR